MAKKKASPKGAGTKRTPKRKRTAADWGPRFLAALASTANVRAACQAARVGRTTVYQRRDNEEKFAAAMRDALDDAVDDLELEARRRALEGLRRVKFHQGSPIMVPLVGPGGAPVIGADGEPTLVPYVEHEYSDVLAMFLLKAHRPEKYRDRVDHRHSGPDGKSPVAVTFVEVTRAALPPPDRAGDEAGREARPQIQLPSGPVEGVG